VSITRQPAALTATRSITLGFAASAPAQCRLDTGAWFACASPLTLDGLPEGDHVVTVRVPGASVRTRRFQVNLLAPTVRVTSLAAAGRTATLRLACSKSEGAGHGACHGTVTLGGLGAARFHAAAGRTVAVKVKLRRALRGKVAVTLAVTDLAGNRRTTRVTRRVG
jgi:hypothetical protein